MTSAPVAALSDHWHLGPDEPHTNLTPCVTPRGTPSASSKHCKASTMNIVMLFLQESHELFYPMQADHVNEKYLVYNQVWFLFFSYCLLIGLCRQGKFPPFFLCTFASCLCILLIFMKLGRVFQIRLVKKLMLQVIKKRTFHKKMAVSMECHLRKVFQIDIY